VKDASMILDDSEFERRLEAIKTKPRSAAVGHVVTEDRSSESGTDVPSLSPPLLIGASVVLVAILIATASTF